VAIGPGFGQPAALVALAIVGCWRLLKADRPALAGLVLAVISVKPHIALLVPFALLLAGHARAFLYWAIATLALAVISLVALQPSGVQEFLDLLATGPSYLAGQPAWTPVGLFGATVGLPLEALLVAGAATAAWLYRHRGPEVPIAVGIVAAMWLAGLAAGQVVNPHVSEEALGLLELKQATTWLGDDLPFSGPQLELA